jgi:hypothetical protein
MGNPSLIKSYHFARILTLLIGALLVVFLRGSGDERLDTYVTGVATRIGYWGDWGTRFRVGESLQLLVDTSMPAGYQRIYVQQDGEIVGALPELSAAQVRAALAAGQRPRATVLDLDPLDPARGVRVRVAFERRAGEDGRPLVSHHASALHSLL